MADVGIADDFSYATSAEVLARTGHVVYNGWSTAMLGWQLYWGALFYRMFGYTWFAIRLSGLTVAVLTACLMHRILLRCGLTPRNAVVGTLTVVLSPLFLPLAYSFMSDVFGLFALLVSLYCCLRALEDFEQARPAKVLVGWLALAMVSSVVLGTTRQISWIGTLTLMPTAAWMMRRRRGVMPAGAVLWVMGAAGVAGLLHWFQMQPYSLRESFFAEKVSLAAITTFIRNVASGSFELPFLILPVTLGFLFYVPWHKRRTQVLGVVMSIGAMLYASIRLHQHVLRGSLLPTLPGVLTDRGMWFIESVELEWWPVVLGLVPRLVASALTFLAVFAMLAVLLDYADRPRDKTVEPGGEKPVLLLRTLLILVWPTIAAYTFLLLSRTMFALLFDRYMPWLMVLLAILGLRYAQRWPQRRPQWLAIAVIAMLAAYGTLAMHDLFALYRARLVAVAILQLRSEGVSLEPSIRWWF